MGSACPRGASCLLGPEPAKGEARDQQAIVPKADIKEEAVTAVATPSLYSKCIFSSCDCLELNSQVNNHQRHR